MNNERTERIKQLEKITHMVGDKLMDYLQDRGLVADCAVTIERESSSRVAEEEVVDGVCRAGEEGDT